MNNVKNNDYVNFFYFAVKKINEECFFNEQCEQMLFDTICSNGKCSCRSERTPLFNVDGSIKCIGENYTHSTFQCFFFCNSRIFLINV